VRRVLFFISMLKLSALLGASITGTIEHGGNSIEFPISIERGADEKAAPLLAQIIEDEAASRERSARIVDESSRLSVRADSMVTPNLEDVVGFRDRVVNVLGDIFAKLISTPKTKPDIEGAKELANNAVASMDEWSAALLITEEQAQAMGEEAVTKMKQLAVDLRSEQVVMHGITARRIAFWCPEWKAEDDGGETITVTPELLEKFSPDLLAKISEEIEKKAPGRSVSR
jgi:hypothetical protein